MSTAPPAATVAPTPVSDRALAPDLARGAMLLLIALAHAPWFAYTSEHGDTFVVPRDVDTFTTDLTSIPWVFAWLVPSNGPHVPGVLLHDGLVRDPTEEPNPTHAGPAVDRVEADRLLREANRRCGVRFLRRWLIWTGVMLATLRGVWDETRWWLTMLGFFGLPELCHPTKDSNPLP